MEFNSAIKETYGAGSSYCAFELFIMAWHVRKYEKSRDKGNDEKAMHHLQKFLMSERRYVRSGGILPGDIRKELGKLEADAARLGIDERENSYN